MYADKGAAQPQTAPCNRHHTLSSQYAEKKPVGRERETDHVTYLS